MLRYGETCPNRVLPDGGESEGEEGEASDRDDEAESEETQPEEQDEDEEGEETGGNENGEDEGEQPVEYELTIVVETAEGEPVPQADLTIESDDLGIVEGLLDDPERQGTDPRGEATFELENAEYTIDAEVDGAHLERTVEIDGEDEEVTLTVDVAEDEEEEEIEEEGRRGPKEAEGEVSPDESASHGTDRGTTVLYLDLEGLFLDLLGLEVDLHEVVLDIRAIPGGGNLLGNLLSAVAGLLSGGPLSALLNRLLNSVSKLLGGLTSPLSSLRSLASRAWNLITKPLDWLRSAAGTLGNALASPVSALRSAASRLRSVLTAPLGWLGGASGGDNSEEEQGQSRIGSRLSNVLPDADGLARTTTSVLDELSGGSDSEGGGASPGTTGHRLGEILGRRLGEAILGVIDGGSDTEETSGN